MIHVKKVLLIGIIMLVFISILSNSCTTCATEGTWADMQEKANSFIGKGEENVKSDSVDTNDIFSNLRFLGRVLTTIGAGILVVLAIIMGIKYITATPETMGKLKTQAIGLVVAAFIIFGAYFIWSMVLDVVSKF